MFKVMAKKAITFFVIKNPLPKLAGLIIIWFLLDLRATARLRLRNLKFQSQPRHFCQFQPRWAGFLYDVYRKHIANAMMF